MTADPAHDEAAFRLLPLLYSINELFQYQQSNFCCHQDSSCCRHETFHQNSDTQNVRKTVLSYSRGRNQRGSNGGIHDHDREQCQEIPPRAGVYPIRYDLLSCLGWTIICVFVGLDIELCSTSPFPKDVLQDQSQKNKFWFYEIYESAAAVDFHKTQAHYQGWADFKESGGTLSSVSHKADGMFVGAKASS
jgi:hypothetical protein